MSRVYDGVDRRAMKIRSWECTERGKVQMSRAGGTPWVYMQEERETLPETAIWRGVFGSRWKISCGVLQPWSIWERGRSEVL